MERQKMNELLEKVYSLLVFLVELIAKYLKKTSGSIGPMKKKKISNEYRNRAVLTYAAMEIGVKEVAGNGDNARIVEYHKSAREDNSGPGEKDSVPWCASFVCHCLENCDAKMQSTNSMAARSFLGWGISSKKDPLPGDIVVFWRGQKDGWKGHVGFWIGETANFVYCLGGNQQNQVNITKYSKKKVLDIRRSSKMPTLSKESIKELQEFANEIRTGLVVPVNGKVN